MVLALVLAGCSFTYSEQSALKKGVAARSASSSSSSGTGSSGSSGSSGTTGGPACNFGAETTGSGAPGPVGNTCIGFVPVALGMTVPTQYATSLRVADLDGDGLADVVGLMYPESAMVVFSGLPDGGYLGDAGRVLTLLDGGGWSAVVIADVDRTGGPEIVASSPTIAVQTYANACGDFGAGPGSGDLFGGTVDDFVPTADTPAPELLVHEFSSDFLALVGVVSGDYAHLGNTHFDFPNFAGFARGDFDGSGTPRIAALSSDENGAVNVHILSTTNYAITDLAVVPTGLTGANNFPVMRAADLDGDGKDDLAIISKADHLVRVFLSIDGGAFSSADYPAMGPDTLSIGDLNGDGYPDLVAAENGLFYVYPNLGDGGFLAPDLYPDGGVGGCNVVVDYIQLGDVALGRIGDRTGVMVLDFGSHQIAGYAPY